MSAPPEKTVTTNLAATLSESTEPPYAKVTRTLQGHTLYLVPVLSVGQCNELIAATEAIGYGATWYAPQYRGNLRLMCDDPPLADFMWKQLERHFGDLQVHALGRRWVAVGLNTRFRFSKYPLGTAFAEHVDTFYAASATRRSFYTVNLYLNDADVRSGTRFNAAGEFVEVIPCVGAALVFPQPPVAELLHEGLRVLGCEKYLMRTDIMFEAQ